MLTAISQAAIEAKFLRHAYSGSCPDCVESEYPCATHRGACESCGATESVHLSGLSNKVDRRGQRIHEVMCSACDPHTGGDDCQCAACEVPATVRSSRDSEMLVLGQFPEVEEVVF